jgi:hypothetical protein
MVEQNASTDSQISELTLHLEDVEMDEVALDHEESFRINPIHESDKSSDEPDTVHLFFGKRMLKETKSLLRSINSVRD